MQVWLETCRVWLTEVCGSTSVPHLRRIGQLSYEYEFSSKQDA